MEHADATYAEIHGLFPGINLKARDGMEVPISAMEIDVAWIEDGDLVIGECKTNGRELSNKWLTICRLPN